MKMILLIALVFLYAGSMSSNHLASGDLLTGVLNPPPCASSKYDDEVSEICKIGCHNCTAGCLPFAPPLCEAVCNNALFKVKDVCLLLIDIISTPVTPNACGFATVPPQNLTLCHDACECCGVKDPECVQKCEQAAFFFMGVTSCKIFGGVVSDFGLEGVAYNPILGLGLEKLQSDGQSDEQS